MVATLLSSSARSYNQPDMMRYVLIVVAGFLLSSCTGRNLIPAGGGSTSANVTVPLQVAVAVTPSSAITGIMVVATGFNIGGVVASNGACTSTGCSFNATAPNDDVSLAITLTNAQGATVLDGSIRLDADEAAMVPPSLVFGGTPATAMLSVAPAEVMLGQAGTASLEAVVYDSQGRRMIGSTAFPAPITVASSDTSGMTTLLGNSIANPTATLTVNYGGGQVAGYGVTFSGASAGVTVTSVRLALDSPPEMTSHGEAGDATDDSPELLASLPRAPAIPPTTLGRLVRPLAATSVDLSPNFPPVANQQTTNMCGVFSAVYGIRTYLTKVAMAANPAWTLTGTGIFGENDNTVFSPTFTYNQQDVNGGIDDGVALSSVGRSLRDVGAVPWTNVPWALTNSPATNYVAQFGGQAATYKITSYDTIDVNNVAQLKTYLASGFPIYFAVSVDNFGTLQPNAVWNGPYDGSKPGGHAMVIVGYDDNMAYNGGTGAFKVLNSWGTTFGSGGYFWITYNWWLNGVTDRETLILM